MKVESKKKKQKFNPVSFTITCDTEEELMALWCITNVPGVMVEEYNDGRDYNQSSMQIRTVNEAIWKEVNEYLDEM